MFEIKDKVAIVTGGASGIGKATVEAILAKGGLPIIADYNEEMGKKVAEELGVPFFKVNVADEEQVKNVVEETVKLYGHLDIIVNNAGISEQINFHEVEDDVYKRMMSVNQDGVVYGCRYAIRQFLAQETPGAIVNVSSMMGIVGNIQSPFYCMAKFGLRGFSKSLAIRYGRNGIRINTIHPGYIETGLIDEKVVGKETIDYLGTLAPAGRIGQADEIAHAIIFTIENEFVTGTEIIVDGGFTAQ
ncbi:MAG: SDR family oxidoreductase [Oscillospiraceae bacterium]|nr:SDR family oxidoreductase [Oscillospiraceae bacterium]